MLSHIVEDLYNVYLSEVIQPQIGAKKDDGGDKGDDGGSAQAKPDEQAAKRIRQAVYDIRYRARREGIEVEQAYNQYMSHTSMNAMEKSAVRDKLGIGASSPAVKEENIPEAKKYLRVDPSKRGTGEKVYYRTYDPSNPKDVSKRHKLETRGIKTTATHYVPKGGMPYDNQAGEKFEKKYGSSKGKNTVGDRDGDGTVEPDRHEYAGVKDNAIKKAMASKPEKKEKKETHKESYSNWREDLSEVVNKLGNSSDKQQIIKEKPVNNKVIINPVVNLEQTEFQLIESIEIDEETINQIVEDATEYFYQQGLNEDGIQILIDKIGEENFCEWVFEIGEDNLLIERKLKAGETALSAKARERITGKKVSRAKSSELKGGAGASKARSDAARREARAAARQTSEPTERQKTLARLQAAQKQRNIEKAKSAQKPTSKAQKPEQTKKGIGGVVSHIVKRAKEDTAKVARAAGTVAGVAHGAAIVAHRLGKEAGKSKTGQAIKKKLGVSEDFQLWIYELVEEGYDLSGHTCQELWEVYSEEFEVEALDTWHPETTTDTSDINKKIQKRKELKAKEKTVKIKPGIQHLLPPDFKESFELNEKLTKSTSVDTFIHDFVHSKNKKFSGKSKKQRIKQALGAYYGKHPEKSKVNEATVTDVPGRTTKTQSAVTAIQKNTQKKQLNNVQRKPQVVATQTKPQNQSAVSSVLTAKQNADTAQKNLAQKQKTAAQKGVDLASLSASYNPEGEMVEAWYSGKGTYRTTVSGRKVRWDEDDATDDRVSAMMQKKREQAQKKASQSKMREKGTVPKKDGKPMFENKKHK